MIRNDEAIDNQLFEARKMMHEIADEDGLLTQEQVAKLMYLAYGKGYTDAVREDNRETRARMAEQLGLLDRQTGEIA